MPYLEVDGNSIELNEQGFMLHQEQWSEGTARALAARENIPELTEAHWRVLHCLRDYYQRFKVAPMYRKLARESGLTLEELEALFSCKTARIACKIAGLPKPAGCL